MRTKTGSFLCGILFPLFVWVLWFHIPKTCRLGQFVTLNCLQALTVVYVSWLCVGKAPVGRVNVSSVEISRIFHI